MRPSNGASDLFVYLHVCRYFNAGLGNEMAMPDVEGVSDALGSL